MDGDRVVTFLFYLLGSIAFLIYIIQSLGALD